MENLFAIIARYSDLLPVLLFIYFAFKSKKQINNGLWVIFFYSVCAALNDNVLFPYAPEKHLAFVMSSFTMIEFFCFTYILWLNTENKKFKQLLVVLTLLYTAFIISYFIIIPFNSAVIDSVPVGVETILVISLSVYFLYEQVTKSMDLVYTKPAFWFITGLLIYLAGCFFIYLYANSVPFEELKKIWFVTFIFTSIKSIFITVAFWMAFKTAKNNNTPKSPEYQPFLN